MVWIEKSLSSRLVFILSALVGRFVFYIDYYGSGPSFSGDENAPSATMSMGWEEWRKPE